MAQISRARGSGKNRRTLKEIEYYPRPIEIYDRIQAGKPWPYKEDQTRELFQARDRALVALTYLLAGRISEILRIQQKQIQEEKDKILIRGIRLSKARRKDKARRYQFRQEGFLPLSGDRARLTEIVKEYLIRLGPDPEGRLFNFGTVRAWQIITNLTGETCHYLRAYGENYLYDKWDHDILAVADYIKVDPRTLQLYIRRSYAKYRPV